MCIVSGMEEGMIFGKRTRLVFEGVELKGGVLCWVFYGGEMNEI